MSELFVLYEHAAGFAIFKVNEFEEISMLDSRLESSVLDLSRFKKVVSLVAFSPFKNAVAALEGVNAISEGIVPEDLLLFIDKTLPKSTKKSKVTLGIEDAKLGAALSESLSVQCQTTGAVPELLRGIRLHFHKLVKGFTDKVQGTAQLGLGHSYSRAKVKFNVHRVDNMIIQSIALLDQLDKDINLFSMRAREWYSYHFPELVKLVPDNYMYAKVAQAIKDRKELNVDRLDELEEVVMDRELAENIISAAESSMGMDISPIDLINIERFTKRVISLADYRKNLTAYLKTKMSDIAPNLSSLLGDQVGARLISHAGSLTNLAKYPASTVQILGAEKALFRALKTKGSTPKYGLIYHSTFIARAQNKQKGRISRFLANKCSIASRIDCFLEQPTNIFGEKLRQQVEDRLKFYDTGENPKKNIDVMKEALDEVKSQEKKKKKKRKKSIGNGELNGDSTVHESFEMLENSESPPKKKKKKKKHSGVVEED